MQYKYWQICFYSLEVTSRGEPDSSSDCTRLMPSRWGFAWRAETARMLSSQPQDQAHGSDWVRHCLGLMWVMGKAEGLCWGPREGQHGVSFPAVLPNKGTGLSSIFPSPKWNVILPPSPNLIGQVLLKRELYLISTTRIFPNLQQSNCWVSLQ